MHAGVRCELARTKAQGACALLDMGVTPAQACPCTAWRPYEFGLTCAASLVRGEHEPARAGNVRRTSWLCARRLGRAGPGHRYNFFKKN